MMFSMCGLINFHVCACVTLRKLIFEFDTTNSAQVKQRAIGPLDMDLRCFDVVENLGYHSWRHVDICTVLFQDLEQRPQNVTGKRWQIPFGK